MIDDRRLGFSALLAGHPAVGPRRLRELLAERGAEAGWAAMGGDPRVDPLAVATARSRGGDRAAHRGRTGLPRPTDPLPGSARVLFALGDLAVLEPSRVAIVGTRRCTGAGAGFARELGRELTEAGVSVVSGLALGIDGASHRGVLDAGGRPIGVVGSGLDVVYPSRHRDLWQWVAKRRTAPERGPARRATRGVAVPGPEPHHRGVGRPRRGGGVTCRGRVHAHRSGGGRPRHRGHGRTWLRAVPVGGGHQPAPRRWLRARARRHRRARGARALRRLPICCHRPKGAARSPREAGPSTRSTGSRPPSSISSFGAAWPCPTWR